METAAHEMLVQFGEFVLDAADGRVIGPHGPLHLGRKALRVLGILTSQPGRLVTKAELFDRAWDGLIVSESALTSVIKELRRALGDDPRAPRFIESVYGRGYRFRADVMPAAGWTPPRAVPVAAPVRPRTAASSAPGETAVAPPVPSTGAAPPVGLRTALGGLLMVAALTARR